MKLKGAQILLECLKKEKVKAVFGYPGGSVLDIYHALFENKIKHILVRHEQAAVHLPKQAHRYSRKSRPTIE